MKTFPFIGRKNELKKLEDLIQKKSSSLVLLRGRRRIGKSRLATEFAKNRRFLDFTGIVPTKDTSAHSQREIFAAQLAKKLKNPEPKANDLSDLFTILSRETASGSVVILLDEISWMGSKDSTFLGKLKNAWDLEFKQNAKLILILCGSVSAWIDENILKNTGFVGRLSLVIDLDELSLTECNQLLNKIHFRGNAYEKFKLLSITGGIPRYLEEIKTDRLADENIKEWCFTKEGILFREFEDIFIDIFARRSKIYRKIIETLVEGARELSDIAKASGIQKSGHLSEYLNDLTRSGFISQDNTWHVKNGAPSTLRQYRISDNYLRFYLKYIEKNKQRILRDYFANQPLSAIRGIDSIMGLQFENMVLKNRQHIWGKLNIYPQDLISDNPWFQKPQTRRRGCQIDYLIQTKNNILYACEIKFSKHPIKSSTVNEVKEKLDKVYLPRGFSILPVLIHVNGVTDELIDHEYFSHIIDFSDLLSDQQ